MATYGNELGVTWQWTNSLHIHVGGIAVTSHAIHDLSVSGINGNLFYGSFSIVSKDAKLYKSQTYLKANPTSDKHTEPQYFEWLEKALEDVPLEYMNPNAFIIEINQTNTPCSKQTCRKAIINAVSGGKLFGNCKITVARMAAYQIYESSYPKVCPTSFEIDAGVKESKTDQIAVAASMCLHRYPENH